jgi:hypothetical protein
MVGTDENRACAFCAYGAIVRAGGGLPETNRVHSTIGLGTMQSLGDWNDAPDRTQAEVVAALRAAAETCP